jgi:2,3-bisphosphoglycerate-independent phosphoglycerate mutase
MKYVIFLGDGMADHPIERLGGKTVLQVAKKPNIDRIAREGQTGLFRTLEPDMATGSAVANLSVMGYNPREVFQGRGVLEAASMGVDVPDGAMAMRCNLICLFPDGTIKNHSAGHISNEESEVLIKAIQDEIGSEKIRFYPGVSYRHLFVADGLNPKVDCAPPHDHPNEPAEENMITALVPEAEETAKILNDLTRKSWDILSNHPINKKRVAEGKDPANSIWLWSPGVRPVMKTYKELFDVTGAVISAVDLIRGLGVYAGLEIIIVEGATGLFDTNFEGKADACLDALEKYDYVYLHVEAPDEAGHEGDLDLKIKTVEDLDKRCIGRVMDGLKERGIEATVAVLPDHATPVEKRIHTRDVVPFAILDPNKPADSVQKYDEVSCKEGVYGEISGDTFVKTLFSK